MASTAGGSVCHSPPASQRYRYGMTRRATVARCSKHAYIKLITNFRTEGVRMVLQRTVVAFIRLAHACGQACPRHEL